MGDWYKVRVFRKNKVFTVNLNETFNIEEKSNMINWENPQFMYSYVKLKSNGQKFDSALILTGDYPNYKLTSDIIMSNDSIIKVYAFEGDGDSIPKEGNIDLPWKKVSAIRRQIVTTLSTSNNFTVDLKQYSYGGQWGNVEAFISIKEMNIHPYFREMEFKTIHLGDSVYQIIPTSKACVPKEYIMAGTSPLSSNTINPNTYGKLYSYAAGNIEGGSNIKLTINGVVVKSQYVSGGDHRFPTTFTFFPFYEYNPEVDTSGLVTISADNGNKITSSFFAYELTNVPISALQINCCFMEVD